MFTLKKSCNVGSINGNINAIYVVHMFNTRGGIVKYTYSVEVINLGTIK